MTPPPLSPCLKRCGLDLGARFCTACGRTLDEIAAWPTLSDARRNAIMADLPGRLAGRPAPSGVPGASLPIPATRAPEPDEQP